MPTQTGQGAPQSGADITVFFWLLLIAAVVAIFARRVRIPYALALVITGLVVGAPHLLPRAHLDPHTLFTVFLPPLLFESALALRADALRRNWVPIALYAFAGTVISALVVGGLGSRALGLPLSAALVFGTLISPTDPISVIAVFRRLKVGKRLSLIVEAESLFNDGVGVVLFGVFLALAMGRNASAGSAVLQFVTAVAGGAAVGIAIGAVASRATRELDDELLEILLTAVVAFGAYLLAETVHVSGVIAVVAAGLVVGNYGMTTGMKPATRLAVSSFWSFAAFAVNSVVFLLIGIEVGVTDLWGHLPRVLAAIGIVLLARGCAVYLLSRVANRLRGDVPSAWQHVLFWGSLHGALSMALALGLGADFPARDTVVTLTFGVVLFSLLGQGLTISPLLRRLRLTGTGTQESQYERFAGQILAAQAALRELDHARESRLLPRAICEQVAGRYRERISRLEKGIDALHLSNKALREEQVAEARRLALVAEKSALLEAERRGRIEEETHRALVEEIDRELASLHPSVAKRQAAPPADPEREGPRREPDVPRGHPAPGAEEE